MVSYTVHVVSYAYMVSYGYIACASQEQNKFQKRGVDLVPSSTGSQRDHLQENVPLFS